MRTTKLITTRAFLLLFTVLVLPAAAFASEYGSWRTAQGFSGLDYRVKKCDYNESARKWEWQVAFRNRYRKTIHFGFELAEKGTVKSTLGSRTSLKAGQEGKSMGDDGHGWKLLSSSDSIMVFIGKVRFGDNDNGPYATSD